MTSLGALGQSGAPAVAGELVALLASTPSVEEFLAELADLAADALDASCGITLQRGSFPLTVASSDDRAAAVDEAQYSGGTGPCLQALEVGEVVSAPDLRLEHRWGAYAAHALAQGVRCSLSLPLRRGVGALNLYGEQAHAFDDPVVLARATAFAAEGSAVLDVALRQAEQVQLSEQLQAALSSRSTIDQAMGIVMAQQRCDAEAAFAVLRAASQGRNRKLRDIAADIVAAVGGHPVPAQSSTDPG